MQSPWKILAYPLAGLFGLAVHLRNKTFDWGWRKPDRLDKPVISVGNLAMGGTGKTPVVAALAGILANQGLRVAVLSRGYGRQSPEISRIVDPAGDWQLFGDEPVLIAQRQPGTLVCVGPSRARAAQLAAAWLPDIYLVDDGYQHRQLARDLNLLLIDVTQPEPRLFPVGLFREGWSAVGRADAVILTRCPGAAPANLVETIRTRNPRAPILCLDFQPTLLRGLDGSRFDLAILKDMPIAAYSGIERPEKFFASLVALGARLLLTKSLKDHQAISEVKLADLAGNCRELGAGMLVTTEKDAVKLDKSRDFGILLVSLSLEVAWADPLLIDKILARFNPEGRHDKKSFNSVEY